MKTKTINLYSFDELNEDAKKKAIEKLSYINVEFTNWWDVEYDSFHDLCAYIGIDVDLKSTFFRYACSQGDGATFTASIDLPKLLEGIKTQAWKSDFTQTKLEFYKVTPNMERVCKLIQAGRIDGNAWVREGRSMYSTLENKYALSYSENGKCINPINVIKALEELIDFLQDVVKTLDKWFFDSLSEQCDYLMSEEVIIETIKTNEYTFTENGKLENL